MNKDPIVIYWAPYCNFDMMYPDPDLLIDTLYKRKNKNSGKESFFACPSFSGKLSSVYSFKFPINASYAWDFNSEETQVFVPTSKVFVKTEICRPPSINSCAQIFFDLAYMFFCEESLLANFTAPYFSQAQYTRYASVAPGNMDIGKWFRPYPIEMTFWDNAGTINFIENEPLFYVEFMTERPIVLKRFVPTNKIKEYAGSCANASTLFAKNVPLIKRYQSFKNAKMDKLIIKEIKNNIL